MNFKHSLWFLMVAALVSCSSQDGQAPAVPSAPASTAAPTSTAADLSVRDLDLSSVMRNSHFAFWAGDGGFRGGHSTYEAKVDARSVQLRPTPERASQPVDALELTTLSVAGVPTLPVEPELRGGELTLDRGVAREVLENTEDGLEQSWEFDEQPELDGKQLSVRIRVTGQVYQGETEHGLHFVDKATGRGLRYGVATWIDARGTRTTVVPQYNRGEIEISVPADVVAGSAYPAVLDPVIGPEIEVDKPIPQRSLVPETNVATTCKGTSCFAVWVNYVGYVVQVVGTRLDASGSPLDPLGIPIFEENGYLDLSVDVASNGTDFLVVWGEYGVYAVRVSGAGQVLDSDPVRLDYSATKPSVAFGTDSYLVAWRYGDSNGYDVAAKRIDSSGTVLDTNRILVSAEANYQIDPVVAFNGTSFFVAWKDARNSTVASVPREVWGARVTTSGSVLDTAGNLISLDRGYSNLDMASDGNGYLLVWDRNCATCDVSIQGNSVEAVRVASNGRPLDATPITLASDNASTHDYARPRVAFGAGNYVATWGYHATDWVLRASRVSPAGTLTDPAPGKTISSLSGADQTNPDVAWNGSSFIFAWQDDRATEGDTDIYSLHLDQTLAGGGPGTLVSKAGGGEEQPEVAFNGSVYLVVWLQYAGSSGYLIRGVRIGADGSVLDATALNFGLTSGVATPPQVASNGSDFLVVWGTQHSAPGNIQAARVGSTGSPGATFSVRSSLGYQPAVTANGNDFYVVWLDVESFGLTVPYLYGARVSGAGALIDSTPQVLVHTAGAKERPAVAANPDKLMAVYEAPGATYSVRGQYIDAATGASGADFDIGNNNAERPDVAANGVGFRVAWGTGNYVYTRLFQSGASSSASRLEPTTIYLHEPSIAWDGQYFLVTAHGNLYSATSNVEVYMRRIGGAGTSDIWVTDDPQNDVNSAIAASAPNRGLVVYSRFDGTTGSRVSRVYARLVDDRLDPGVTCTTDAECSTGHCVDKVCCDTACSGTCEACTQSLKGYGSNGVCQPIADGRDPNAECADQSPSSCGQDGMCNGAGACRLYPQGTVCGVATTCSSNRPVSRECDGVGACVDSPGSDCAPYACLAGACSSPCAGDGDCASGYHCDNNACVGTGTGGSGGAGGAGGVSSGGTGGASTGGASTGGAGPGGAGGTGTAGTGTGGAAGSGTGVAGAAGSAGSGTAGTGAGGTSAGTAGDAGTSAGGTASGGTAGSATGGDGGAGNGGSGGVNAGGSTSSAGGSGGNSTAGGSAGSSAGGSGATAGGSSAASGGADDGGCGCRTVPNQGSRAPWLVLPGLLLLGLRRRRRLAQRKLPLN